MPWSYNLSEYISLQTKEQWLWSYNINPRTLTGNMGSFSSRLNWHAVSSTQILTSICTREIKLSILQINRRGLGLIGQAWIFNDTLRLRKRWFSPDLEVFCYPITQLHIQRFVYKQNLYNKIKKIHTNYMESREHPYKKEIISSGHTSNSSNCWILFNSMLLCL